jgi:hypothetical protein
MVVVSRAAAAWRNLVRRRSVEHRLDEELAAYLELLASEKIAAGLDPVAARRAARLELGVLEQVKQLRRAARARPGFRSPRRHLAGGLRGRLAGGGAAGGGGGDPVRRQPGRASYLPARRATRSDPLGVLRQE